MSMLLEFKVIAFDTQRLPREIPAGSLYPFFKDVSPSNASSVTSVEEKEIIRWLFEQSPARNLIFSELQTEQDSFFKLEVTSPIISDPRKKPGDIDVLICGKQKPHQTIAIECKRVKVTTVDRDNDKVNKINGVGDGVRQANALREFGFHRTYFAILIEVEGKNRTDYNVLSRGSSDSTFTRVYDFPHRDKLHEDIGVIFIEITQPTGKHIDEMAVVGICIDKEANRLDQPTCLTNRIHELLEREGGKIV